MAWAIGSRNSARAANSPPSCTSGSLPPWGSENPSAQNMSSVACAKTCGTPSRSRTTSTGPESPAIASVPEAEGTVFLSRA